MLQTVDYANGKHAAPERKELNLIGPSVLREEAAQLLLQPSGARNGYASIISPGKCRCELYDVPCQPFPAQLGTRRIRHIDANFHAAWHCGYHAIPARTARQNACAWLRQSNSLSEFHVGIRSRRSWASTSISLKADAIRVTSFASVNLMGMWKRRS